MIYLTMAVHAWRQLAPTDGDVAIKHKQAGRRPTLHDIPERNFVSVT
jgi:hypothetical protein